MAFWMDNLVEKTWIHTSKHTPFIVRPLRYSAVHNGCSTIRSYLGQCGVRLSSLNNTPCLKARIALAVRVHEVHIQRKKVHEQLAYTAVRYPD